MEIEHDYTSETFFKNLAEAFIQKIIHRRRLITKWTLKPDVLPGDTPQYRRQEFWTDKKPSEIAMAGYVPSKGLHDSIAWLGTKIYAKIENGMEFPISQVYPTKKDTAYTLNDAMLSDADTRFKKSLARAALSSNADWQKIILIGGVGILAVILTKYFGIW